MIILIICWLISRFLTDNKMVVEQDTSTTDVFIKSSEKPAEFRSSVDIPIPKSSILSSSKSSVLSSLETPKKKVSFLHVNINDKDSSIYSTPLQQTFQSVERQLKMAEHSRQLYSLQTQTRRSTFGRARSAVDLSHYDSPIRKRPWLNFPVR